MDRKSSEGKVYTSAYGTDSTGIAGTSVHTGIYDQRDYSFPACLRLSEYHRGSFICQKYPYDLCVLGICLDVPSSGAALEYDDRDGRENV